MQACLMFLPSLRMVIADCKLLWENEQMIKVHRNPLDWWLWQRTPSSSALDKALEGGDSTSRTSPSSSWDGSMEGNLVVLNGGPSDDGMNIEDDAVGIDGKVVYRLDGHKLDEAKIIKETLPHYVVEVGDGFATEVLAIVTTKEPAKRKMSGMSLRPIQPSDGGLWELHCYLSMIFFRGFLGTTAAVDTSCVVAMVDPTA
ncbi:hypothetical protein AMTR_s00200p00018150 [Amborella trichopoda]|uniref:Uncharacterized protein n=1 Tax=Amborella trichopoda TaxID=13333 RepID=W1NP97_AMBTC|nr:hypothetical protein AMTR_s00200p00018150 [Amborella trichopoda]